MLSLVGAGKAVYPVAAQASRYVIRPDIAYVPIRDAPPCEWRLIWRKPAENSRIRPFVQTAVDLSETLSLSEL